MEIDENELRRLVFVAQQRRWRFVSMPVSVSHEDVDAMEDRFQEARLACEYANTALLDFLQAAIDKG